MGAKRWLLGVALLAAAATATLLGVALTRPVGESVRGLLIAALVMLIAAASAGGLWALADREDPIDPLADRAETVSKLSHELKNPLMAIKGLASTGARMYEQLGDDEKREFFQLIDEESARMKRVVEQAATALKVDAESILYEFLEEDLGELVEETAAATPRGDHSVSVDAAREIIVLADRRCLTEALDNLLDNAAKFSPPDAPIEVTVRHGSPGTGVIEVADRGPGIPAERAEAVFERFGSWRPAGYEETPGAGLGLFVARAHVLAHEGRVDVLERDDGGTILRVTLPVVPD
ncbi:MAG TPA: HAMP domain-containing sensor histidine kinase [Actinomycetota bacterium]|nr:HAMP domain-containing sensor histidine kinase [Actinomycetota bacterium]